MGVTQGKVGATCREFWRLSAAAASAIFPGGSAPHAAAGNHHFYSPPVMLVGVWAILVVTDVTTTNHHKSIINPTYICTNLFDLATVWPHLVSGTVCRSRISRS